MKLLLFFFLSLMLFSNDTKVFVCKSNTSVAYHSKKTCRGIKICSHDVVEVDMKTAVQEYKKRACKVCY